MAQAALALYFRNEAMEAGTGLLAERFLELVMRHDLASRNTAAAFLKEMLKYGIVRHVAGSEGRRHWDRCSPADLEAAAAQQFYTLIQANRAHLTADQPRRCCQRDNLKHGGLLAFEYRRAGSRRQRRHDDVGSRRRRVRQTVGRPKAA